MQGTRYLVFITTVLGSLFAHASSDIDAFTQSLPADCYHAGQYQQAKSLEGMPAPLITHGRYVFACNNGLIWHTQSPIEETSVYTTAGDHIQFNENGDKTLLNGRVHRTVGRILNNIIGGDRHYISKNFTSAPLTDGISLIPKKRGMKKFIQSIELKSNAEGAVLVLFHPKNEFTQITISDRQVFDILDQPTCRALLRVPPQSCNTLFN